MYIELHILKTHASLIKEKVHMLSSISPLNYQNNVNAPLKANKSYLKKI
jgi:hypothetical protein